MATKDDTTIKPETINPMLEWWSRTMATGHVDREMKRYQALASDVQSLATETYGSQIKALSAINERFAAAVSGFAGCRQHLDVAATASKLFADLMEVGSQQARLWADLSQTLRGRFASAADEFVQQSSGAAASAPAGEQERASPEPARRKSA
jgi:hypothetical protein